MKLFTCLVILLMCAQTTFSQEKTFDSFNLQRQKINKTGFRILTAYTAANIIYGSIAASHSSGSDKYFHQMNVIWNGITLGIVGVTFLTAKKEGVATYGSSLRLQNNVEKLFLFNAGLDLTYIAGGAYLKEHSFNSASNPNKLKGYGESIMLQGGVLFLFDSIMYLVHTHHGRDLYKMSEKIKVATTASGTGIIIRL